MGGSGAPTFNPEMKEERRAPPEVKHRARDGALRQTARLRSQPGRPSPTARGLSLLPWGPPEAQRRSQLTADRVSDSGGGKRGKECVRTAPHPHFTPAILRSRCGRAGSLRTARSHPPSTAQPWKAVRTPYLPHPRGVETATQTGSPQGLGPPKASQHSRSLRPQGEWGDDVLPSNTRLLSELLPAWAVGNRLGVGLRG